MLKLRKEVAAMKRTMVAAMNGGGTAIGRAQQLVSGGPKKGAYH